MLMVILLKDQNFMNWQNQLQMHHHQMMEEFLGGVHIEFQAALELRQMETYLMWGIQPVGQMIAALIFTT